MATADGGYGVIAVSLARLQSKNKEIKRQNLQPSISIISQ